MDQSTWINNLGSFGAGTGTDWRQTPLFEVPTTADQIERLRSQYLGGNSPTLAGQLTPGIIQLLMRLLSQSQNQQAP